MLKDGQAVMGLKIYEKNATQNKHMKAKTKKTKCERPCPRPVL